MIWILVAITALAGLAFFRSYRYWSTKNFELECALTGTRRRTEHDLTELSHQENRARLDAKLFEARLTERDGELAAAKAQLAELEQVFDRTAQELVGTKEDVRFWRTQTDHFQEMYEKASSDAIHAREVVADWVAQRTFGRSIFSKAPALPAESLHKKPVPRTRIQGRLAVQLADQEFARRERELEQAAARERAASQPARPEPKKETVPA